MTQTHEILGVNLAYDGTMGTVVDCYCSCGESWTERFSGDYREGFTDEDGELDFDAMRDDIRESVECPRADEDDSEPSDDEPSEGDYVMSPAGPLGAHTALSIHGERFIGEFASDDEETADNKAEAAIAERMKRERFYPSVWTLSDHGNYLNVSERFYQEHSDILG